jgi:hypothetical protein
MIYPPVPLFKRTTLYLTSTFVQGRFQGNLGKPVVSGAPGPANTLPIQVSEVSPSEAACSNV